MTTFHGTLRHYKKISNRSGAVIFSLSLFFLLCSRAIIVLYCIVATRGNYLLLLLLLAPPPPHAATARRRTPPSSQHPPPPLPQHATAVTPESFADVPVCPYPRSYSSTIEQRISWLASCKSCCCRRFSRLVPHSNDQHRRLAIVVRRRRLRHRPRRAPSRRGAAVDCPRRAETRTREEAGISSQRMDIVRMIQRSEDSGVVAIID